MGLLGDIAKGILIYTCIIWVIAIVGLFVMGLSFLATIAIIMFIIPLGMVISEYLRVKRKPKPQ